jgi:hypothetical protein
MVKRREPKASGLNTVKTKPTPEQVESFAAGAEGIAVETKEPEINQNAIRDFKAMRVPFNEYEYNQLVEGAHLSGRTKLNFMRYAMLKLVKELQDDV